MTQASRHPFIHWLAILALLVNGLLPGLAHAARHGSTSGAGGDLCLTDRGTTGAATQIVLPGIDMVDPAAAQHIGQDACCLYCLTHAGTSWVPLLSEPILPPAPLGTQTLVTSPPPPGKARVCHDAYAARAPPFART